MSELGGLWKHLNTQRASISWVVQLSQLVFPRERNPNIPWEKSWRDSSVVKKKKKEFFLIRLELWDITSMVQQHADMNFTCLQMWRWRRTWRTSWSRQVASSATSRWCWTAVRYPPTQPSWLRAAPTSRPCSGPSVLRTTKSTWVLRSFLRIEALQTEFRYKDWNKQKVK